MGQVQRMKRIRRERMGAAPRKVLPRVSHWVLVSFAVSDAQRNLTRSLENMGKSIRAAMDVPHQYL